jgi:acetyl-CoA carboxylase carboxyl transferase subunit beta
MSARQRLEMLFDNGQYEEYGGHFRSPDPLDFVDRKAYRDRLNEARRLTGLNDATVNGCGFLSGYQVLISGMESAFISGSMGCVVGEMITMAVERATNEGLPLIVISASGGARMHEGVLSLMQMAKISAALARLDRKGLPFVSVLTDPTTGGVTASYAMLGDLNIAEPNALIGFAGPRVIEQTIRQKLPKGFQRSEFLLEHGMLDAVIDRRHMKEYLTRALHFFLK